jgi:hypothetical protein
MNQEGLSFKFEDISDVLGVLVGNTFDYNIEMFVVGLHHQLQDGIAYLRFSGELLITSIVASSAYKGNKDYRDICHYQQQGGNNYKGEKRELEDKIKEVGNKALMNSYKVLFKIESCTSSNLNLMIAITLPLPPNLSKNL